MAITNNAGRQTVNPATPTISGQALSYKAILALSKANAPEKAPSQSVRDETNKVEFTYKDSDGETRSASVCMASFQPKDKITKVPVGPRVYGFRLYGTGGKGGQRFFTPWVFQALFNAETAEACRLLLDADVPEGTAAAAEE